MGGGEASVAVPNDGGISTPFRRRMSRFSRSRLSRSLCALSSGVAGRDDVPPMVAVRDTSYVVWAMASQMPLMVGRRR